MLTGCPNDKSRTLACFFRQHLRYPPSHPREREIWTHDSPPSLSLSLSLSALLCIIFILGGGIDAWSQYTLLAEDPRFEIEMREEILERERGRGIDYLIT